MSVEALRTSVPDHAPLRVLKEGYRDYPIDTESSMRDDPLVLIGEYSLAGQAYYSRSNSATSEPVSGVPKELYVRKTVAEKLQTINSCLVEPFITEFFGGEVELYIEDAHRSSVLQRRLRNDIFPQLLRTENPDISGDEMQRRLDNLIAKPTEDATRPSPHATGGAIDVVLRYKQSSPYFVKGVNIELGHEEGNISETVYPDHFEGSVGDAESELIAQRNRRAFYAIMTGLVFDRPTDMQVNPTEWWHWSYGDQMWAKLRGKPAALYGFVDTQQHDATGCF